MSKYINKLSICFIVGFMLLITKFASAEEWDVDYFNNSNYDLLLCTGDIPYHGSDDDQALVSRLAMLAKRRYSSLETMTALTRRSFSPKQKVLPG